MQGKHNGDTPLLGYDVNQKQHYEMILEEVEAVRFIFQSYLDKYSYREICKNLNSQGYRTKRSSLFRSNSLFDILRNPKYCGRYVLGRTQRKRKDPRNNHHYLEPIVQIENAIPAIISVPVWEEVQKQMNTRKNPPRNIKGKTEYLLTGYIQCDCEAPYCGVKQKSKTQNCYFNYYK